jgi:hypothetical protein
MFIGTHYRIGGLVYNTVISKHIPFSPADRIVFQIGNILPDISNKLSKLEHSRTGSSIPYRRYSRKSQDGMLSSNERLLSIGVIGHYTADYFCSYHAKEPYKNHSLPRHLFYELRLHLVFLTMYPGMKKIIRKTLEGETSLFAPDTAEPFSPDADKNTADIAALYYSLQKDYHACRSAIKNDILFALKAVLLSTAILMRGYAVKVPLKQTPVLAYDIRH